MLRRQFFMLVSVWALALLSACATDQRQITDTATSADGTSIRYDSAGSGDVALVFVHCWTCNRGHWDKQMAYFAPNYRVVRLDLAGHGESGKDRRDYTIPAFAADVRAVVDKLGLKRVILVGHSMGGPVSLEAEKQLGKRVIGVVGVDTFYTAFKVPKDKQEADKAAQHFMKPFEEDFAKNSEQFMRQFFAPGADPALVDSVAKQAATVDKAMALSALRNVFAWYATDAETAFQRVGKRLRNINGDPKGENKPLHPSVVLIPGTMHFPAQEKPAAFNEVLEKMVQDFSNRK